MAGLERAPGGGVGAARELVRFHRVVEQRRGQEVEQHEHHDTEEQDAELHRDLEQAVEQQREPALRHRLAGEVAAHL